MFELIVLHDMYNKTRTIVVGFLGGEYSVKNLLPFKYKCFMDFFLYQCHSKSQLNMTVTQDLLYHIP